MFVGCPIAQIVNVEIDNLIFLGSLHHALAERRAADFRKQSQDVDFHERRTFNIQPAFARLRRDRRSTSNAQCLTNQSGGSSSPCSMPKLAAKPHYCLTSPPKAFGADPPTNLVGQSWERAIPRSRGWRAGRDVRPSWPAARELREWSGRCGR